MATMFTAVIFAAFTGSSVASATTLGVIAYPNMKKRGYPTPWPGPSSPSGGPWGSRSRPAGP